MTGFFTNLLVYAVALGFSVVFVWLGRLAAEAFDLGDRSDFAIAAVLSIFVYMYLKYVTVLRIELKQLEPIRQKIEELAAAKQRAKAAAAAADADSAAPHPNPLLGGEGEGPHSRS